jgi:hypothetical protein
LRLIIWLLLVVVVQEFHTAVAVALVDFEAQ